MKLNPVEITGIILFLIGFYGLLARRNIIKTILALGICEIGVILFFLGINFTAMPRPPIDDGPPPADPVPQSLMITAIIIGAAVTAVGLMMFIVLYHRYGSTNWHTIKKIRDKED